MKKMLSGDVAVATYPLGQDNLTTQCAFDFDNHDGNTPALPRLRVAKYFIEEVLGLQAIPESTGSPDSYHLWIPIVPTPPAIVHDFLKAVLAELKKEYPDLAWHGTEVFPKTKNKNRALGIPLKLSLSINNKSGKRSEILGDDLEPVDAVYITKLAELQQPEEVAVVIAGRSYIPVRTTTATMNQSLSPRCSSQSLGPRCCSYHSMRPCIAAAINKQLNGGEGNFMRVAVVRELLANGYGREEIIDVFSVQNDFDRSTTAYHVDKLIETSDEYGIWKCQTLQDQCPSFVDCDRCPLVADSTPVQDEEDTSESAVT
jgi:hypothetical protein